MEVDMAEQTHHTTASKSAKNRPKPHPIITGFTSGLNVPTPECTDVGKIQNDAINHLKIALQQENLRVRAFYQENWNLHARLETIQTYLSNNIGILMTKVNELISVQEENQSLHSDNRILGEDMRKLLGVNRELNLQVATMQKTIDGFELEKHRAKTFTGAGMCWTQPNVSEAPEQLPNDHWVRGTLTKVEN